MPHPGTDLEQALDRIPSARFVLTSAFEDSRSGTLVKWIQRAALDPPMLSVAAHKGHSIEPLIRDSHAFGVCLIDPADRFVLRTFVSCGPPDNEVDPFDSLPVVTMVTGSPLIVRSIAVFDCRVVRHLDLEADHELYIGQVVAGRTFAPP